MAIPKVVNLLDEQRIREIVREELATVLNQLIDERAKHLPQLQKDIDSLKRVARTVIFEDEDGSSPPANDGSS